MLRSRPDSQGAVSPPEILELADACVRFVERVTKVRLDFTAETLPILDHYLRDAGQASADRVEAKDFVALAAGAYFGEIVRRRYPCWWRVDQGTASARIEFATLFLAFSPMDMMRDALDALAGSSATEGELAAAPPDERDGSLASDAAGFELDEADQPAVEARLAELPHATVEEYYAPSTRLEVLDIVVDAIRAKRLNDADPELALEPGDYDDA